MQNDISTLEEKIGHKYSNKDLLLQALTHRSYLNENHDFHLSHNERLEFLGDAVLELVVTEHLFNEFPKKPEGEMTNWRAALVNTKMLARVSEELGVNDFLLLSRGESKSLGKARELILANALEAIIGSLYEDSGYKQAQTFITENILKHLQEVLENKLYIDPKSKLQEKTQELYNITPHYDVLEESGPDHKKHFVIGVFVEKHQIGKGEGYSKQQAQVSAAEDALKQNTFNDLKFDEAA